MTPESRAARLALSFKGDRDYLQGGDIFNALAALTGARQGILFQMRKLMRHPLEAAPLPPGQPAGDFSALFEYDCEGGRRCYGVREDLSSEVGSRTPYDEAAVTAGALFSRDRIESPGPGAATFMERVIALNKIMLNARFSPERVKWLFTRLELDALPAGSGSIVLTFAAALGTRLTKSAIEADGVPAGYIYFSRGQR